ncbi:MAG: nitrate/nitrite transporter NrtS [Sphingorhabdus sp.]
MRSLKVALIVGTALNLINQGDAVFGTHSINWLKLVLTFIMPYAVSTYGAVAVRWDVGVREKPASGISN